MDNWTTAELRHELAYQTAGERDTALISTWGPGQCGHMARGSGYCADCLRAELRKREG